MAIKKAELAEQKRQELEKKIANAEQTIDQKLIISYYPGQKGLITVSADRD